MIVVMHKLVVIMAKSASMKLLSLRKTKAYIIAREAVEIYWNLKEFFLLPEFALYLCKSTTRPFNTVVMSGWVLLAATWIYRTVGPSRAAILKFLTHSRNKASLNLFNRCYFGRCSSELAERVTWFFCHHSRRYKYVYANSFFPRTAKP